MKERILLLAIVFGGMLTYDWAVLRHTMSRKELAVYAALLLGCIYMGFDYTMNADWPDYYDLVNPLIADAAKTLEALLKP